MTPKTTSLRIVTIAAALSLVLAACAQDGGAVSGSDTTTEVDPGTLATDTTGETGAPEVPTTETSEPEGDENNDFGALSEQAAAISTHVATADIPELSDGWSVIQDHVDQLSLDASGEIDASLRETVSADLDTFDTTIQRHEAELSSEFVADWEAFYTAFQAALSVTG